MGFIKRLGHYRRVMGVALLIQGAAYIVVPAPAARAEVASDVWIDELVLEVVKKPYRLSEAMIVIQQDNHFYVPLMEMADMLDFAAEGDVKRGVIAGWAGTEDNVYNIDISRGEYVVKGEKRTLSPDDVITGDEYQAAADDIYISTDIISEIWPLKMDVDFSALQMVLSSDVALPFEARKEREAPQELVDVRKKYMPSRNLNLPMVDNPYRILGMPVVDIDTSYRWDRDTRLFTGTNTVSGKMDLLGMSTDFSAVAPYDADGLRRPDRVRLTGRRRALGDDDLALGFREAEAGDTRIAPRSLITNSVAGRGVVLSTREIDTSQIFDQITVEGRATPGWETELYRNNELLDFGTVDNLGEYRFENVQLMMGNNTMRVVLYGPQGQIEERSENYVIGGGMVKPGEFSYEVGMVDADRDLIPIDQDPRTGPRGVASNGYVAYGVGTGLTLFGGATRMPVADQFGRWQNFVSGGAMFNALGGLAQVELYREMSGGHALDVRFAGSFLGINVNAQQALYRDFESADAGYGVGAKRTETDVSLNKNVKTPFGALGLQVDVNHQELNNDNSLTAIGTRQSINKGGVRFTHQTNTSISNRQHQSSSASLSASTRVRSINLRGTVNYDIYPEARATSLQADAAYTHENGLSVGGNVTHDLVNSISGAGATVGYDFKKFLASVETGWLQERGVQVMLRASTSLAPYGIDDGYIMSSQKLTAARPVRARIFLDNDGDSVFSEGDAPLPDSRVQVGLRSSDEVADADGYVLALQSGGNGGITSVQVDKAELGDPYYVPGIEGYNTVPRAASIVDVQLPVVETGAIDGTVMRPDGEGVGGMTLQLVNEGGKVVMTTETAYDGFYTFEYVRMGTYTVRADPSYGVNVPPVTVSVASDELFAYGRDLELLEQAVEEKAQEGAEVMGPVQPAPSAAAEGVTESGGVAQPHHDETKKDVKPAPDSSGGDYDVAVKGVRIGEHPDKVRLVLDLSGPVAYEVALADGDSVVTLDLPQAAWDAMKTWRSETTPVISSYEVEALPGGGTRLLITGRAKMIVADDGKLAPADGLGHRVFIDLQAAP
jgi:hypothetical protein